MGPEESDRVRNASGERTPDPVSVGALDLSDRSVRVSVVGEHGPTAVALLSSVRIMGMTLDDISGA